VSAPRASVGSCLPPLEEFSALSLVLGWVILVITILSLIRHLIFKNLDELVEKDCDEGSEN